MAGSFPALDAELARAAGCIEGLFLEVGNSLVAAADSLSPLIGLFDTLAARIQSDALRDAVACLHDARRGLAAIDRGSEGNLRDLERMDGMVGGIRTRVTHLSKTIGEVRLLSINARVEAAHVVDVDVDFSVFTHGIGRLSSLAEQGLAELGAELAALGGMVAAARDGRRSFDQERRQSLGEARERIDRSIDSAELRRSETAGTAAAIAERGARMKAEVGGTVPALQIGDITRQRIEHVRLALGMLERSDAGEEGGLSPDEHRRLAMLVHRLQADQLARAAADLEDGMRAAGTNLRALRDEAAAVGTIGRRVFGDAVERQGSFLHDLADRMRSVHALILGHSEAGADLNRLVRAVSGRVDAMVHHVEAVHSIEVDLRIMGLNATLKCGRLGESGRALSVVAQALRTYAAATVADAGELMAGLEGIIAAARDLARSDGLDDVDGLSTAVSDAAAMFDALGREAAGALDALEATVSAVSRTLDSGIDRIGACSEAVDTLRRMGERLAGLAGEADAGRLLRDLADHPLLSALAERYTMAAERDVHLRRESGDAPSGSMADEVDDVLF